VIPLSLHSVAEVGYAVQIKPPAPPPPRRAAKEEVAPHLWLLRPRQRIPMEPVAASKTSSSVRFGVDPESVSPSTRIPHQKDDAPKLLRRQESTQARPQRDSDEHRGDRPELARLQRVDVGQQPQLVDETICRCSGVAGLAWISIHYYSDDVSLEHPIPRARLRGQDPSTERARSPGSVTEYAVPMKPPAPPSPRRAAKEEDDPKASIRADSKIGEKVLKARRLERTGRRTSNLRHEEEDELPPLSTMQRGRQRGEAKSKLASRRSEA